MTTATPSSEPTTLNVAPAASSRLGKQPPQDVITGELDETRHYTVLYGYGIVPATSRRSLGAVTGSFEFVGGVRRDVPGKIAKLWRDGGWMVDGNLVEITPESRRLFPDARHILPIHNLFVLPNIATEADYLRAIRGGTGESDLAAAVSGATPAQTGAVMKALSAETIVEALGREDARLLAEAICDVLGLKVVSTPFGGGAPATPQSAEVQRAARRTR